MVLAAAVRVQFQTFVQLLGVLLLASMIFLRYWYQVGDVKMIDHVKQI